MKTNKKSNLLVAFSVNCIFICFISALFLISSCGSGKKNKNKDNNKNENADKNNQESNIVNGKRKNKSGKIAELLPLLSTNLKDDCASFPSFIESPYQEFPDIAAKGGLFFDGNTKKFNKQYSYYSSKSDLNNFNLSWKTELGSVKDFNITTYKLNEQEIPMLKCNWISEDKNNTAEVDMVPVIDYPQEPEYSGTIQYAIYTKYWRVIGFRKLPENEFYDILNKMGEIKGMDVGQLKIKRGKTKKK